MLLMWSSRDLQWVQSCLHLHSSLQLTFVHSALALPPGLAATSIEPDYWQPTFVSCPRCTTDVVSTRLAAFTRCLSCLARSRLHYAAGSVTLPSRTLAISSLASLGNMRGGTLMCVVSNQRLRSIWVNLAKWLSHSQPPATRDH